MTPQENVDLITTILIDAIRASGMTQDEMSSKCDMSRGALIVFMERKLKTGGSLNSFCAMLNAVGGRLKIEFPLSPDSAGVLPVETTATRSD